MANDPGEALFERYLKANGYDVLAYEPDLGTTKRPDYLVQAGGQEVVVEVESFNTPPMPLTPSGAVNMRPKLRAVRNKLTAGAAQLKGIEGRPLIVVLANPRNSWVPLEGPMFIGALFGDPEVSFAPDDGIAFGSGRNGRLHVKEPDGSVQCNHPYLSAVAVIRFVYPQAAWAAAMAQSQEADADPLAVVREATQLLARPGEAAAEAICADMYETVSESAVPLARDIFAGPNDTRWGVTAPGRYGQVAGPRGLWAALLTVGIGKATREWKSCVRPSVKETAFARTSRTKLTKRWYT